ncbi:LOW QUALITY PROTEIN: hypothetical protein MAR_015398 [Mya arenaria]|uniref:Exonuclease domain-containing protein n=1 Tax=Mya arenaria TaxID=6604 RepID=A0ABY7FKM3_MYAAR|nr:LOW QUALITY PROTEIN: hypothetical protein MAR_015398 [Mya arenaria]
MRRKKGQFISKSNANRASIINNVNVEKKTCISVPETVPPWLEGRRVVEIGVILERLSSCSSYGNSFCINGIGETIYGLGSFLHISCNTCRMVNLVPTEKRHSTSDGSAARRCFDVNTKLAAGKFCHHINSQRCANKCKLNLPGISKTALKAREREVGPSIESVAEISCTTAIQQEMKLLQADTLLLLENSQTSVFRTQLLKNLQDMQGSEKEENKIKTSFIKNWNGSSKAMEPFLTSTCLQEVKQKGLNIERLTMDGDSTTFTRLKSKHKSLSNNNIAHIQKCFSYGISQNKGSTHGIKTSLDALPSHMFNEHSSCSPTWCTSLRDENYRQAHILQGTELRKDFQNVIHGTNANENMNHVVARKAPKTVTYSESESLGFRVSAAVLYQHCKEVTSVAASEALLAFKRWLEAFGSHILLVAHNVMFDARLTVYPGRQNYRLASLVHDIAGVDFGAHDASEDVYALSSILQLQTNLDKLSNCATTVSSVKFKLQELNNEKIYKGSYTTFVESKIISKAQAKRLSRSGISIEHLKKVYSRSGLDGMQAVLKDRGAGKFYTKVASALDAVFSENKINLN